MTENWSERRREIITNARGLLRFLEKSTSLAGGSLPMEIIENLKETWGFKDRPLTDIQHIASLDINKQPSAIDSK